MNKNSKWLTPNLIVLTLVSFTQDAASDLLYPLLPILLTGVIGAAPIALGLIEGCAEAAAGFTKLWAGNKSDYVGRKPFIVAGYGLAGIGKAMVVVATAWPLVFFGRITDRIGKGMRSTPRDALINDSVPDEHLGKAFGFHRAGDNFGAVVGPLIAVGGLWLLDGDVRAVAQWALIPALLSGLLTIFIKDKFVKKIKTARSVREKIYLPSPLKRSIGILVFIQLTNIPDALLLLRLYDIGLSPTKVVLAYAFSNLVATLAAYPAGVIADKFSPQLVYIFGLITFAIAYCTLGLTQNHHLAFLMLGLYGFFSALTDGVGKSWIARLSQPEHRGRAQGVYQASMNFAILGAGIWGGAMWSRGTQELPLVLAGIGAALGAAYFTIDLIGKRFAHSN
jgi:MFS family permease